MTRFGLTHHTRQTPEETVGGEGEKTKLEKKTKKVTVTTAPCQNSYIFPLGLTETKGVFLERRRKKKKKKTGREKKKKRLASADRYRYQTDVRLHALCSPSREAGVCLWGGAQLKA